MSLLYQCYSCEKIVVDCFPVDFYGIERNVCLECVEKCVDVR